MTVHHCRRRSNGQGCRVLTDSGGDAFSKAVLRALTYLSLTREDCSPNSVSPPETPTIYNFRQSEEEKRVRST